MSEHLAGVSSSLEDISLVSHLIVMKICAQKALVPINNKVQKQIYVMIRFQGENLQQDNMTLSFRIQGRYQRHRIVLLTYWIAMHGNMHTCYYSL